MKIMWLGSAAKGLESALGWRWTHDINIDGGG